MLASLGAIPLECQCFPPYRLACDVVRHRSETGWKALCILLEKGADPKNVDRVKIESERKIKINGYFPWFREDHFLQITPAKGLLFNMNANAFYPITSQIEQIKDQKFGELYRLIPNSVSAYFVSQEIVEALKKYPWEQHRKQIDDMLQFRTRFMEDMREKGYIPPSEQN